MNFEGDIGASESLVAIEAETFLRDVDLDEGCIRWDGLHSHPNFSPTTSNNVQTRSIFTGRQAMDTRLRISAIFTPAKGDF